MAVRETPLPPLPAVTLVHIRDLAGRPRGTGFVADELGTVVTSHEAVDGLTRVVLHAPGERTCLAEADAIVPLPETDLALVRTEGLGVRPVPVAARERIGTGTYVRLAAGGWREARVLRPVPVTYTATDRFHLIDHTVELAMGTTGSDALRLGGPAAGGPVLDAETGAVLAVLGTALCAQERAAGFAVPLRAAAAASPDGPLAELLRRNAATVPCYGPDLNLAGALRLAEASAGTADGAGQDRWREPVERPDVAREFEAFSVAGRARVLALVGEPGAGRTTELAVLARRRADGPDPAPTLRLRGADLRAGDASVADAVGRALEEAGRTVAASGEGSGDPQGATPERVARLARDAGRPLLVLLDDPEEMPPALTHRLPDWTAGTVSWLRATGARLVVACRAEHWEAAGAQYPEGALHRPARPWPGLPPAVRIGNLTEAQALRARERYAIPDGALADPSDARHPLTLRLLAEVREALAEDAPGHPSREDVFAAYLDLMCLRVAVRLAAARPAPRGAAVRRMAARVAGRVHEAARRCPAAGHGGLDRESFDEVFPWHTGWASAVLAEGLLEPAGSGYRFVHEELADWLQAAHLDIDAALHSLVHAVRDPGGVPPAPFSSSRAHEPAAPVVAEARATGATGPARSLPVARHRVGPVVQALLLRHRLHGPPAVSRRLMGLVHALEGGAPVRPVAEAGAGTGSGPGFPVPAVAACFGAAECDATAGSVLAPARAGDAAPGCAREWGAVAGVPMAPACAGTRVGGLPPEPASDGVAGPVCAGEVGRAARLLREVLSRVPDAGGYLGVLRVLADSVTRRSVQGGGPGGLGALGEFGPGFWERLRVAEGERMDLLRRLLPADGAPGSGPVPPQGRYLDAVARRIEAAPRTVQPMLCQWFDDERPLPAADDAEVRPTVADVAQALLYARRELAVDDLAEALADSAHPRADELLAALAEEEPSALCRAVDRWSHDDERPARRVAAALYGPAAAPHVTTEADRELLRYAALALLTRPGDGVLHGPALGVLVRDPDTRSLYLPRALTVFGDEASPLPAAALAAALPTHPEPVLDAFRACLAAGGEGVGDVLRALADVSGPVLARRAADLVREYVDRHPAGAAHAAAYVDRRLEHGPGARAVLFPLVAGLLRDHPGQVRRVLAPVLAAPGSRASRALRAELLDVLLECEQQYVRHGESGMCAARDLGALEAVLLAAGTGARRRGEARTRDLVHRTGMLLVRTTEGAVRFDRLLAGLAREVPEFAALVAGWLVTAPHEWAAVVGPSTRRTVESLGSPMPMRAAPRGHGSLRPA
ncbi:serine protease [Streptomyces sp. NPDC055287]